MFAPAAPTAAPAPHGPHAQTAVPAAPAASGAQASSFQPHMATPAVNPERVGDRPKGRSSREELAAQEHEAAFDDEAALWAFAAFLPRSCPFLAHYIVQEILKIVAKRSQSNVTAATIYRRIYGLGLQNVRPAAPGAIVAQEVDAGVKPPSAA